MAAISLREYHRNLEKLLRQDVTDRVIGHCRHILQVYSRNGETYRLLGRALAASGQWEQAADILRRVLSVYPDDDKIHETLATVYQHLGQPDGAIWHLERALEVQPNNVDMINGLRRLYREQRGTELTKIPLTSSAAAHQYRRSGMYSKTIAAAQQALERDPIRVDLRLLLARTYWEHDQAVAAAEAALQVLDELPFCFDANRILAELWLREDRPTDATPYLNIMEQIDPYIALEIVQDDPVPDDTFMIEELNFQRLAQQELVASGVNLFGDLDLEDVDEEVLKAAELEDDEPVGEDDFFATEVPADWSDEESLAAGDDDPLAWMDEGGSGLTGMLEGDQPTETADDDDPLAWMNQGGSGLTGMLDSPSEDPLAPGGNPQEWIAEEGGDDPLAWLSDAGGELLDEGEEGSEVYNEAEAFKNDTEEGFTGSLASDPMAWLGDDFRDPDAEVADGPDDDLLAWMNEENFEDTSEFTETGPLAEAPPSKAPAEGELLDWMQDDDDSLLDEMISMEALASDDDDGDLADLFTLMDEDAGAGADDQDDDLSNLFASVDDGDEADLAAFADQVDAQDADEEDIDDLADLFAEADAAATQSEETSGTGNFDVLFGDDDALDDEEEIGDLFGGDAEDDDDLADFFGGDDALAETDMGDDEEIAGLFGEDSDDDDLDWLGEASGESPLDDDDEPDWMAGEGDTSDFGATVNLTTDELEAEADALDWMTAFEDDDDVDGEDAPDFGATVDLSTDDDDDPMGWLSEYEGDDTPDDDPAGTVMLPSTDDIADDDALDWMTTLDDDGDDEGPGPEDDDNGDWLAGLPGDEPDDDGDDDGLDWLGNLEADEGFFENSVSERQTAALPYREEVDWLADVGDAEDEDPMDIEEDDDFDMLADAAAIAEGDRPDWLSELQTGDLEDARDDESVEQADSIEESNNNEEGDEPMGDDMYNNDDQPDWLSSLGDDEGDSDDAAFEDDAAELDWLGGLGDGEDEVDEGDVDWLSGLGNDDEGEDDLFGEEAVAEEQPDWLGGLEDEDADEDDLFGDAAVAEEQPDWLGGLGDEDDSEDMFEEEAVAEDQPDWLAGLSDEDDSEDLFGDDDGEDDLFGEEAVAEDQPDWLGDLGDEDSSEDMFGEEAVAEDQPDWLAGLGDEDDSEDLFGEDDGEEDDLFGEEAVAEDQPDWLGGLEDEDADEDDLFGDAAVAEEQPDWLGDLGDEDSSEDMFGEEAVAEDQPDWLAGLGDEDDSEDLFGEEIVAEDDEALEWVENEAGGSLFDDDEVDFGTEAVASEETGFFDEETAFDDVVAEEQPDWLAELDEPSEEEIEEGEFQTDWLDDSAEEDSVDDFVAAELEVEDDGDLDYFEPVGEEAEPDWLTGMDVSDDELDDQQAPSWLDDAEPFDDADEDMMDDPFPGEEETAEEDLFGDPFEADEVAAAGAVGLGAAATLGAMAGEDDEDAATDEYGEPAPDWLTFDPNDELLQDDEAEMEDDYEIASIDTAPEWLNAMVPGLDMDFAPENDEQIETSFIDAEGGHRTRDTAATETGNPTRAFKWLLDIVDEEADSVVAPARRRPRFVFTRPPLWLWRRGGDSNDDDASLDDLAGDGDPSQDEPAWLDDAFDEFDDFDDED